MMLISCFASEGDKETAEVRRVHSFTLSDQFKKKHTQAFPGRRVIVLALADHKGSEQLEDWISPFYKRYGEQIDIYGVANLKGVPGFMKPLLRKLFRKGLDYPVMMDWSGEVCKALSYDAGRANILILCPKGGIRYRINGEVTEKDLQDCFSKVDGLLKADGASKPDYDSGQKTDEAVPTEAPQPTEATSGKPSTEP
jgi:hypothetical protein